MLRDTLGYFNTTPPDQWCFVRFYEYRKQQTNFKKSFDLEAFNLQKALIFLSEKGTTDEKKHAVKLSSTLKRHRTKDQDSRRFWDKVEEVLLHEERMEKKWRDMELVEFGAAYGVMERIERGLKRPHETIRDDDSGGSDGDESPSELASSARQKEMHGDSEKSPNDDRIVKMIQRSYQAKLAKDKLPIWEFNDPMPGWLIKAKEMHQKLKAQSDAQAQYKSALR